MQTNNSFSFQRFVMLIKLSLYVNKRLILISLAGVTATIFIGLIFLQAMVNFEFWGQVEYITTFFFIFLILGFIYSSQSFPAFRSKTKSLSFLVLPASNSEKYVFELLMRIIIFVLFMPLLYWVVANVEGTIIHHYVPQLINYKFSFLDIISNFSKTEKPGFWGILAIVQALLFAFTAAFTGASHFSKSPLIKTLLTFSTIVTGYCLYSFLLFRGLNLNEYQPSSQSIFFDEDNMLIFIAVAGTLINLSLLAIAWFRLKEKEA